MGSDSSPETLYAGVLDASKQLGVSSTLVVFTLPETWKALQPLNPSEADGAAIELCACDDVIAMDEAPLSAIRQRRKSSMVLAVRALRDGHIDAMVSAGNTGALVAASTVLLKRLPGIHRPALMTVLPSEQGAVAVLDVGGNVQPKAQHLLQFAVMGAAYQQRGYNLATPRVGLLNIGTEELKGTSEHRDTFALLKEWGESGTSSIPIQFCGNVEGRDVFRGVVDVLVTDGFTGNVFLKTAEGVSAFLLERIRAAVSGFPDDGAVKSAVEALAKHVNYDEYPGAIVCGVEGVVVKCHGYSSSRAMANGILGAASLLEKGFVEGLNSSLSSS
ncbi:Phosphate acyltransferase [Chlamydiales bacterium SCGC AG-110-P3]|nr:Phosphate acyltransferase [Chlamydiales bacterium SCGC AG-110-P3]